MEREEEIRKIAYHMWELEEHPDGKDLEFWLMAENIWEINHRSAEKVKGTETGPPTTPVNNHDEQPEP